MTPMDSTPVKSRLRSVSFGLLGLCQVHLAAVGVLVAVSAAELSAESAPSGAAYDASAVDVPPSPKGVIRVHFPRSARRAHGEIHLKFLVTASGKVSRLTVVKFTDPDMIDPAYRAYEKAEFTPGLKNGKPVDTWLTVTEEAR